MDPNIFIAITVLAGTLFASWTTYKSSKNATRVGLEANAFQRAVAAEEKVAQAEEKMEATNRRLRRMESDLVTVESKIRYIVQLIHDPYVTLEFLRERIPANFNHTRRDRETK